MTAADRPVQRPHDAKLLVIDEQRQFHHSLRQRLMDHLRAGDLVVANDAATLPASLHGTHVPTRLPIEVRLAGRRTLQADDVSDFHAVVFGPGDFHTCTEHRQGPPALERDDRLRLGPLSATVTHVHHPRLIDLHFDGAPDGIRAGIARHGRPIQYAHLAMPLELWDVWTPFSSRPVAFEPPSAGFALDWGTIAALRERGIRFVTITHAAGISSTGDDELDRKLPFEEPYDIPDTTAAAITRTKASSGRIVAVGTTVVRALEHAALEGGRVRAGAGVANQRIGPATRLRVADVILTGVHERGTSHYELLRAFADDATLQEAERWLEEHEYRTHEFGDSVLLERAPSEVRPFLKAPAAGAAGRWSDSFVPRSPRRLP